MRYSGCLSTWAIYELGNLNVLNILHLEVADTVAASSVNGFRRFVFRA